MNEENSVCIRINVKIQFIESSSVAMQSFIHMVVAAVFDLQVIIMTTSVYGQFCIETLHESRKWKSNGLSC